MRSSFHRRGKRAAVRRRKWPLAVAVLLLLAFGACIGLRAALLSDLRLLQGLSDSSLFFQNGAPGQAVLSALTGIPANKLDRSAFTKQANGRIAYQGPGNAIQGVDVSSYQGAIDWDKVKQDGIGFAVIRVAARGYQTDGVLAEDPNWKVNLEGAVAAGLPVGVYLFSQAISPEEAREEAAFVLDRIKGYPVTYPVVFDWEPFEHSARTDDITSEALTDACIAFCEAVQAEGYTPMVYCNLSIGLLQYDLHRLAKYDFWLAQYNDVPTFYGAFQIWQYSNTGRVEGISTKVDLNLCFAEYPAK
ncbi:MAG: glycoside hydrolase family 25 protein [Oscillospiraceae bacterium]